MDPVGHGSKQDLAYRMARIRPRIDRLGPEDPSDGPERPRRLRRPWGEMTNAITTVLGTADELRGRDIHVAVEVVLGQAVSPSSVKNCLAVNSRGADAPFERVGWGLYRLRR
jgi:hypothetical protein